MWGNSYGNKPRTYKQIQERQADNKNILPGKRPQWNAC